MSTADESQLFDIIHSCKRGQREAIVGGIQDVDGFWNELYVGTEEDKELRSFFLDDYQEDGRVLLVTGSAGDGTSALLSTAYHEAQSAGQGMPADRVNLDATASSQKRESYHERLDRFLSKIQTAAETADGPRAAVAINYGLAIDFFQRRGYAENYPKFWAALEEANDTRTLEHANISVLNLSHRRTFEFHPDRFGDGLLRDLLDQFDATAEDSPFHEYYQRELERCPAGDDCPLLQNVQWFGDEEVREKLTSLLAGWSIVTGTYLNPRTILDIVATSLVPHSMKDLANQDGPCKVGAAVEAGTSFPAESYLWNSFFETLSKVDRKITSTLDPAAQETPETNQKVLEWSADINELRESVPIGDSSSLGPVDLVRTSIRANYLRDGSTSETILDWSWFDEYRWGLTVLSDEHANVPDRKAREVYETIRAALQGWTGVERGGDRIEFADGLRSMEYRFDAE
jgi:DNA phosphorothioation-dependent restriction protein DptF